MVLNIIYLQKINYLFLYNNNNNNNNNMLI